MRVHATWGTPHWQSLYLNIFSPLTQPPLTPVYFAAALVLHRGAEVTRCEPDMAMVHHLLSKIPDELVRNASEIFQHFAESIFRK